MPGSCPRDQRRLMADRSHLDANCERLRISLLRTFTAQARTALIPPPSHPTAELGSPLRQEDYVSSFVSAPSKRSVCMHK